MKKIINHPDNIVNEMIEGIELSFPHEYERINQKNALLFKNRNKNKVSIVIGGGSGHEPMFFGFLGKGWADAVAIGNVFTAPNPLLVMDTAKAVDNNKGVIFFYGNHSGDLLNFGMASDLLKLEGIQVGNVIVADDVGSFDSVERKNRRGVAGGMLVLKILGAAAEEGKNFEECLTIAEKVNNSLFSIGVGISPGINPVTGKKNFEIEDTKLEFGIGVHGEPGKEIIDVCSAEELSYKIIQDLDRYIHFNESQKVVVLVNGLGAFTLMEQLLISRSIIQELHQRNVTLVDTVVGDYFTTNDMSGFSVSILVMNEEMIELYKKESFNPFFKVGG